MLITPDKKMTDEEFRAYLIQWLDDMQRMMTDIWIKWS